MIIPLSSSSSGRISPPFRIAGAPALSPAPALENSSASIVARLSLTPLSSIQAALNSSKGSLSEKKIREAPKNVETSVLGFLCDIDVIDHNGVIASDFEMFFGLKIPLIISRSLLAQSDLDKDMSKNTAIKILLAKEHTQWDIYLQKDGDQYGELILFIPKQYASAFKGKAKLRALGFSPKNLERVSYKKVITGPNRQSSIQDFFALFRKRSKEEPLPQTFFFLDGHGNQNSTGGFKDYAYMRFLDFLQKREALALSVSSCYAAGSTSLLHLRGKSKRPTDTPLSFPVFLHSIGDVYASPKGLEEGFKAGYFEQLTQTIIRQGGMHRAQLQRTLKGLWSENELTLHNLMMALPPHKKDSPSGFRPIGENDQGFALTYTTHRQYQLPNFFKKDQTIPVFSPQRPPLPSPAPLVVTNKALLEVFPLCISATINIESQRPVILSMVPGPAHHLFAKIICAPDNQDESIFKKTLDFYSEGDSKIPKAFFVGECDTAEKPFSNIVFYFSEKRVFRLFKIKEENKEQQIVEKYVYIEQFPYMRTVTISADLFALEVWKTVLSTTPSLEAIRSASGGQESEQDFRNALLYEDFWNADHPIPPLLDAYLYQPVLSDHKQEVISEAFQELIQKASPAEKSALLSLAIPAKRTALALYLIQQPDLNVNGRTLESSPLLCLCAATKNLAVASALLANGADINAKDSKGRTPLFIAMQCNQIKLVEMFLDSPDIDMEAETNGLHWLPIAWAKKTEILNLFIEKGAQINVESEKGITLLGLAVHNGDIPHMELLMAAGVDVDEGIHSPLNKAIARRNEPIVDHLLQNTANPNQTDRSGDSPMVEAVKRGTPAILQLLINYGGIVNKEVLMAVYVRGAEELLHILLEQDPQLIQNNPITITELLDLIENKELHAAKWILTLHAMPPQSIAINDEFNKTVLAILNSDDEKLLKLFLKLIHKIPEKNKRNLAIKQLAQTFTPESLEKHNDAFIKFLVHS